MLLRMNIFREQEKRKKDGIHVLHPSEISDGWRKWTSQIILAQISDTKMSRKLLLQYQQELIQYLVN